MSGLGYVCPSKKAADTFKLEEILAWNEVETPTKMEIDTVSLSSDEESHNESPTSTEKIGSQSIKVIPQQQSPLRMSLESQREKPYGPDVDLDLVHSIFLVRLLSLFLINFQIISSFFSSCFLSDGIRCYFY